MSHVELRGGPRSIYNYPEHLNPFYEDEQHKRLRFWNIGRKNSINRRGSFTLSSIKEAFLPLKSFRLSKRSSALGINKTSASPPPIRKEFINSNYTSAEELKYATYNPHFRQTISVAQNDAFQRRGMYRSSLQNIQTEYKERFFRSTRTPIMRKSGSTTGITPGSSMNSLSTNPFDYDSDIGLSESGESSKPKRSRKKRRAPLPPTQIASGNMTKDHNGNIETSATETNVKLDELSKLTQELESFVQSSLNDEETRSPRNNVEYDSVENHKLSPDILENIPLTVIEKFSALEEDEDKKCKAIEDDINNNREIEKIIAEIEIIEEDDFKIKIEEEIDRNDEFIINKERKIDINTDTEEIAVSENVRIKDLNINENENIVSNKKHEIDDIVKIEEINTNKSQVEINAEPIDDVKILEKEMTRPVPPPRETAQFEIATTTLRIIEPEVRHREVSPFPFARTENEAIFKSRGFTRTEKPIKFDDDEVVLRVNEPPVPPVRRRSVKDIIESINRNQKLLKINQPDFEKEIRSVESDKNNIKPPVPDKTNALLKLQREAENEKKVNELLADLENFEMENHKTDIQKFPVVDNNQENKKFTVNGEVHHARNV